MTFWESASTKIDDIYDKLVKNRNEQALKLGYKDYVEMSYDVRTRFGYDRYDVERYRKQILDEVVPVAQKLYARQAKRIGVDDLEFFDLALEYPNGNAKPIGTTDEKVTIAQKMYQELSPESGAFFDFMVEHELFDLDSKPGKMSGGYCDFLVKFKSPFIFANYNGTSGDVDVLTHEAGHAFQAYLAQDVIDPTLGFPTIEAAEIFSMSMEFIAWPWMENFFMEQTTKYKFSHLSGALQFLPYGVLVDHFQQEVYENPDMTPSERKATWRRLEKMYCPERDYSEIPELEDGMYWYRQGHIFGAPFYYIDYTLAQVVAFQFWKRFEVDGDEEQAWKDYVNVARQGGTITFLEIVEQAGLKSPFADGALNESIQAIDKYLEQISEDDLK
jgi:M3 family oligoendopeptidase